MNGGQVVGVPHQLQEGKSGKRNWGWAIMKSTGKLGMWVTSEWYTRLEGLCDLDFLVFVLNSPILDLLMAHKDLLVLYRPTFCGFWVMKNHLFVLHSPHSLPVKLGTVSATSWKAELGFQGTNPPQVQDIWFTSVINQWPWKTVSYDLLYPSLKNRCPPS